MVKINFSFLLALSLLCGSFDVKSNNNLYTYGLAVGMATFVVGSYIFKKYYERQIKFDIVKDRLSKKCLEVAEIYNTIKDLGEMKDVAILSRYGCDFNRYKALIYDLHCQRNLLQQDNDIVKADFEKWKDYNELNSSYCTKAINFIRLNEKKIEEISNYIEFLENRKPLIHLSDLICNDPYRELVASFDSYSEMLKDDLIREISQKRGETIEVMQERIIKIAMEYYSVLDEVEALNLKEGYNYITQITQGNKIYNTYRKIVTLIEWILREQKILHRKNYIEKIAT